MKTKWIKSEFALTLLAIIKSTGMDITSFDPQNINQLVEQLNKAEFNEWTYILVGLYAIVRTIRKWQKDHYELRIRELELNKLQIRHVENGTAKPTDIKPPSI
jgi:hypothetical protein